ncbi:hypothetical protein RO3G_15745 [Rhizopus delemar RA 99-880]|uniref:Transposase Tc1-like domain-containing protein n=1 Tax=Rhizopus delemar (strain RA 99-880 / ATCC MYA-4621 / FGSC 9543 / NRRL 43880) TaxID=246409 RepID=I1CRF4_RHIO9|nr:hypothetical protein RO3G_15745 [Rhizopus delemar RA 99-880]|eukprot:EIE91034.1 hypothetical protein RO3G_15745 [Rhizopus delemar RA 99-880]
MELAKLGVFVSIETLRSHAGQLDFESYRAAHKPTLTARHHKSRPQWAKERTNWTEDQWRNVVWSDESRFCVEDSRRYQETHIHILVNRFHTWFKIVTMYQERSFIFQEDGVSCHTYDYAQ